MKGMDMADRPDTIETLLTEIENALPAQYIERAAVDLDPKTGAAISGPVSREKIDRSIWGPTTRIDSIQRRLLHVIRMRADLLAAARHYLDCITSPPFPQYDPCAIEKIHIAQALIDKEAQLASAHPAAELTNADSVYALIRYSRSLFNRQQTENARRMIDTAYRLVKPPNADPASNPVWDALATLHDQLLAYADHMDTGSLDSLDDMNAADADHARSIIAESFDNVLFLIADNAR